VAGNLFALDWKTMKTKQQVQLIDLMINDYRRYNLKAKPAQSAQYYSDELQQIVEHYQASAIPKCWRNQRYSSCLRRWLLWMEIEAQLAAASDEYVGLFEEDTRIKLR